MLTLLLVLGQASAAVQCTAVLAQDDRTTTVVGYGDTEPEARRDAEGWAHRLAAFSATSTIGDLLFGRQGFVDRVAAWNRSAIVPGSSVTAGMCSPWEPPSAKATEATVGSVTTVRANGVVAVRSARRRACLGAASETFRRVSDELAYMSLVESASAVDAKFDEPAIVLRSCLAEVPLVVASKVKVDKSHRKSGTWRCVDPHDWGTDSVGPTLEHARESALTAFADSQLFMGLAKAHHAHAMALTATHTMPAVSYLSLFGHTVGWSEEVEAAVLACGVAPTKATTSVQWLATRVHREQCGVREDMVAMRSQDPRARRRVCDASQDMSVVAAKRSLTKAHAETRRTFASYMVSLVMECRSSCRRGSSVRVPGEVPFAPRSEAELRALAEAPADLDAFLGLFASIRHPKLELLSKSPYWDKAREMLDVPSLEVRTVLGRAYFVL